MVISFGRVLENQVRVLCPRGAYRGTSGRRGSRLWRVCLWFNRQAGRGLLWADVLGCIWRRRSKVPTTESIIDIPIVLVFLSLLLSLCVSPAPSHSLIVASHAVNAPARFRKDEPLYLSGTGAAGKACGMVRCVPCEERSRYEGSGNGLHTSRKSLI